MESDNTPVKSSLPEQTRPCEPDNDTDVDRCIQQLLNNDPSLKEVNLNNMKVRLNYESIASPLLVLLRDGIV